MSPVPRIVQLALGPVAVVGLLLLVRTGWSFGTQVVVAAGFAAATVLVTLRYERRLPRGGPEPAAPNEVMPGARVFVHEFENVGFRRLGGFRWALRGRLVISTVLAPTALDRYAIATDRVLEVASRFGDLMLITTNSGWASLPDDILRQVVRKGSPAELVRAHQAALDLLARRGVQPDRFLDDKHVLSSVRDAEERALRLGRIPSLPTLLLHEWRGDGDRELGDDDETRLRVEMWLDGRPWE